jgi:CP family cyanate transporter-like MFS transporter
VRPRAAGATGSGPRWSLVVAIVLTALNLRTAVTSVGPLLDEVQAASG